MRWILCLWVCVGCDDGAVADDPEVVDARPDDASSGDGGPTDRGPIDAAADVPIMGDSDAGFDCPPDEPITQTVRFVVRNTGAMARYVPLQGDLCVPFVVRDDAGRVVPQRVTNMCSAECNCVAGTPLSWVTRYVRLDPGEEHTFAWEARYADRCEREVYCPEFEDRGREPRFMVAQPVWRALPAAASYTVELAYEDALPDGCGEPMTCQGPSAPHWFGRCEAGGVSETRFLLGAATETTVEIDLP